MFPLLVGAVAQAATGVVLTDVHLPGGASVEVEIRDGRFTTVGVVPPSELPRVDLGGATIVPGFVDSHVHLAYYPVGRALADAGVVAAVDLAAPVTALVTPVTVPRLVQSGPMITAIGGYPTQSWGADGYGREVATPEAAEQAVRELAASGAKVIKVPLQAPALSDAALARVVETAHALHLPVVAHALDEAGAARAAAAGVDGLAHTPVEPLSAGTIAAWSKGFVISTLRAFGGSPAAVANLRALRAAGTTVLYGTDLGNTRDVGIDKVELGLLKDAGLDGAAIVAAGTAVPAAKWGFADLGAIAVGKAASFLVVSGDPNVDPQVLAKPKQVWIDGVRR